MNHSKINAIIEEVTDGIYKDNPILLEKFGERGREKCKEDNEHHIKYLQTAAAMGEEKYFVDYALWLNGILTSRGMKTEHLVDNFQRLKNAFEKMNADEHSGVLIKLLEIAIESLSDDAIINE
ncbi:hypothetical protein [Mesobacillus selenatarsenatis]|uniref:Uncharacterized protein n=1 Tax=Mesobacillus selenatarsenatis (strain DSM 18680 / JCM 14380 / FERM P-15431 / SF-1) TaxID=1321606 RepID=A0A0A8X4L6_MESS1|nr:hypothetical protein [Mesobacillus selenatarsenatis]GAM13962.1 hypothetical protein SAMD00020551_2109 [Mesobacillus selenatarsenatis SF-1]